MLFEQLKSNKIAMKREYVRKNLIEYYKLLNRNKVDIPAFILANEDIKLIEKCGNLDFWYKKLVEADERGR